MKKRAARSGAPQVRSGAGALSSSLAALVFFAALALASLLTVEPPSAARSPRRGWPSDGIRSWCPRASKLRLFGRIAERIPT